jgi:hypothetical protein
MKNRSRKNRRLPKTTVILRIRLEVDTSKRRPTKRRRKSAKMSCKI